MRGIFGLDDGAEGGAVGGGGFMDIWWLGGRTAGLRGLLS